MKKHLLIFTLFPLLFFSNSEYAYSETIKLSQEGGMEIEIIHPDSVLLDRTFSISFLIQNNGWESKQDIRLTLTNTDNAFVAVADEQIKIEELTASSSFGTTLDYVVSEDATEGTHFINIDYSQVLLSNNVDPMPLTQMNFAIPIEVQNRPEIIIETITPESIFANSEFSIQATITSEDIDLEDVTLEIIAPDVEFRGDTYYKLSSLEK